MRVIGCVWPNHGLWAILHIGAGPIVAQVTHSKRDRLNHIGLVGQLRSKVSSACVRRRVVSGGIAWIAFGKV